MSREGVAVCLYSSFNLGTRRVYDQRQAPAALCLGKGSGWTLGTVWTGAENFASTGIGIRGPLIP